MELAAQIETLDTQLLKPISTEFPDPLGAHENASVRAFLVLTHACFEEALEDAFEEHAVALSRLCEGHLVARPAVEFAMSAGYGLASADLKVPYSKRTLSTMVHMALGRVPGIVRSNNGIKNNNIRKLAEVVGINWSDFEFRLSSALDDLETLGAKRGESGHLSPFSPKTFGLKQSIYPDDARGWVTDALAATSNIIAFLQSRAAPTLWTGL